MEKNICPKCGSLLTYEGPVITNVDTNYKWVQVYFEWWCSNFDCNFEKEEELIFHR